MNRRRDSIDAELQEFLSSVAPDLYVPAHFISWREVAATLTRLRGAILALQALVDSGRRSKKALMETLGSEPTALEALLHLLSAGAGVGFSDGRELPRTLPSSQKERAAAVNLLIDLGIWEVLGHESKVEDLLRIALVSTDAPRRRFRLRRELNGRLSAIAREAIDVASLILDRRLEMLSPQGIPEALRSRRLDYVVAADEFGPVAAIETVFQAQSGGRQQRDLALVYPALQAEFDQVPLWLILIADGRGIGEAPTRVLRSLLDSVGACMTLRQAEEGALTAALVAAAEGRGRRAEVTAPLGRIIEATLSENASISASSLPTSEESGRVALAEFVRQRDDLALELGQFGANLQWVRRDLVLDAIQLGRSFDQDRALRLFANLLEGDALEIVSEPGTQVRSMTLHLNDDPVLPNRFLVASETGEADREAFRQLARYALQVTPESKLAVLIVPSEPRMSPADRRRLQSSLSTNVVTVETAVLRTLAEGKASPRDRFVTMVLEQSDLTKASPFVLSSVTPERMYFGRESEEATLLSTVSTNSIALLGGRRIGKTSLLRHVVDSLTEAGFMPLIADCQTVRNWDDFGRVAGRSWRIALPKGFAPENLFEMVSRLQEANPARLVILLDEIDELLDWDEQHTDQEVPEAFFRACRTISQEGRAQFVFTGERTIAKKLWDAHSPHWNFCRPLYLQQLTRESSDELLLTPLRSLQIHIDDPEQFTAKAWRTTSGHPQILQVLGDRLIGRLNERVPEERSLLSPMDIDAISQTYEFAEHYLETYWGQSTPLERLLTLFVSSSPASVPALHRRAFESKPNVTDTEVHEALRMLELYGIIRQEKAKYALRAQWFPDALTAYGGVEETTARLQALL